MIIHINFLELSHRYPFLKNKFYRITFQYEHIRIILQVCTETTVFERPILKNAKKS